MAQLNNWFSTFTHKYIRKFIRGIRFPTSVRITISGKTRKNHERLSLFAIKINNNSLVPEQLSGVWIIRVQQRSKSVVNPELLCRRIDFRFSKSNCRVQIIKTRTLHSPTAVRIYFSNLYLHNIKTDGSYRTVGRKI